MNGGDRYRVKLGQIDGGEAEGVTGVVVMRRVVQGRVAEAVGGVEIEALLLLHELAEKRRVAPLCRCPKLRFYSATTTIEMREMRAK